MRRGSTARRQGDAKIIPQSHPDPLPIALLLVIELYARFFGRHRIA